MTLPKPFKQGLLLAALVILLDQASKLWLMDWFGVTGPQDRVVAVPITGFFDLVAVWNKGVSFSLFSNHDGSGAWILSLVALVITGFMLVWLWRAQGRLLIIGLGLVIGGALGNVIDRVRFGAVFDFLLFYYQQYSWPAFNVADMGISVGVGVLLIESLVSGKKK
ncbi:MAG: signal peptidase II [Elstera sp.]